MIVSTWSKGRIALLGDAAWGSGPTGMGTTLSLVAAHVLAGELGRALADPADTFPAAFARYEAQLRRYADSAQGLPPGGARITHPSSAVGQRVLRGAVRVAVVRPVRGVRRTLPPHERAPCADARRLPEAARLTEGAGRRSWPAHRIAMAGASDRPARWSRPDRRDPDQEAPT